MKKLLYILFVGLLLSACTKEKETTIIVEVPAEGDPVQQDPDDTDGDGVKNIIEEIDSTDPDDPCSYLEERQNYVDTTEAWRNLDCDGDGVTNGTEVDPDGNNGNEGNGTDPRDRCDFEQSQQTVTPTQQWSSQLDCDEDGVSNGQEVSDGTQALDPCSLLLESQTSQPEAWLELDCDEDCVSNEVELQDGTNPFDGSDFLGNGTSLYQLQYTFGRLITLEENGSRLKSIDQSNGTIISYNYANDKLISAQSNFGDFIFEYQNNLLTTITKTINGTTEVTDIAYQGNTVVATGTNSAPGAFYIKLTFDATGQNLLVKERFYQQNGQWILAYETILYYDNSNLIRGKYQKLFDYNITTGELNERLFEDSTWGYQYFSDINNPLKEAVDKIKMPIYLAPELVSRINENLDFELSLFAPNSLSRWVWADDTFTRSNTIEINCTINGENPTRGVRLGKFGDFMNDVIFLYD